MPAIPQGGASYRWLIITLAAAAGMYVWYALSQYNGLNELNQRQLSNAGAELKAAIDNAVVTVKEFNRRWEQTAARNQPHVCDFVRSQPYLEFDECLVGGRADPIPWKKSRSVQAVVGPKLGIRVTHAGDEEPRLFHYETDRLLRELAFPDSFALIFVASDSGDVFYQDAPTRRRWLRHLRWGERTFRDTQADRPPTLRIQNVQQVVGGEAAWKTLRSVSSRTTVAIAGTSHQLYLQPLTLDGPQPVNLVIGGAVPRASIVRDALALGVPLLGVLVFVLLFGLLGFPFVKLACLDRHERFTWRDIKLLYVSAGALLVLLTCASLAVDGYVRWQVEANRGLDMLAGHLQFQFIDELRAIRSQLERYDEQVKESAIPCDKWDVHTNWFAGERVDGLRWPAGLHLRTVAWIEPGGQQIWKSTADPVPGKLRVGHRVYFRAVRDGHVFTIDGGGPPIFISPDRSISDGKFYTFVSMRSDTARRCAEPESAEGTGVVAATAQLLSLESPPLPAGYGFALINREGRVLYHSDGRLSLRENLYEELSQGASARAIVYAGRSHVFATRYRERPHTFTFHPLPLERAGDPSAAFYLAVFRDTSVEQALVGHVFVIGLVTPMVLLFALCGVGFLFLSLVSRRTGRPWRAWLWPHRGLNHIYKRQAITFLALLVISSGLYLLYGTVIPFLVTSVLAPLLGVLIYWLWEPRKRPRARLVVEIWQQSSILLVLVCMIVVPSAALFRLALSHEFAKLILTERDWIDAQKDDRLRAARVEALEDRYAAARLDQLQESRARYAACVPAPFDAARSDVVPDVSRPGLRAVARTGTVGVAGAPAAPAASLVRCTTDTSGARARGTAMLQSMGLAARAIDALGWLDELLPVENEILARQHFQPYVDTYSPNGTIVASFRASGIALVGFALTLGLLAWWTRWNTDRVFLADLDASERTPEESCDAIWEHCSSEEQMVLLQVARERIANPRQRPIVATLLRRGVLQLKPDLQPFSPEFDTFLHDKAAESRDAVEKWETVNLRHSWRHGRLALMASIAGIGFFLIATQPALQSSVIAIATAITGLLTAGTKLREALMALVSRNRTS